MEEAKLDPINLQTWIARASAEEMSLPEFLDTHTAIYVSQLTGQPSEDFLLKERITELEAVRHALNQALPVQPSTEDSFVIPPHSILDFVSVPVSSLQDSPRGSLPKSTSFELIPRPSEDMPMQGALLTFQSKVAITLSFAESMVKDDPRLSYEEMQSILIAILRTQAITLGITEEHVISYFHSLTLDLPKLLRDETLLEQVRQLSSRFFTLAQSVGTNKPRFLINIASLIKNEDATLLEKLEIVCDIYQQALESLVE